MSDSNTGEYDLIFDKDVPVPMSDGTVLRANVFRPHGDGTFPVVLAKGAYGKDIPFRDGYRPQWDRLKEIYPDLDSNGTTGRFLRWETVDPERWVPEGFAVVTVQSRGSGKSPGYLDTYSPTETRDYAEAIDWAGTQPWSNGKVGLLGVSYFATKQWQVAALQPKHLAAMVPWEGCCDFYREWSRHGGIRTRFPIDWWPRQILPNQHGNGDNPRLDPDTGEQPNGTALSPAMLEGNRSAFPDDILEHVLDDAWYHERTPDFSRITVPFLSAGNWGGPGLHLRGNIEGYLAAASTEKWLSVHIGTHFESFYMPDYVAMQKRFLGHYLRGDDNGWETEPKVQISVRGPNGAERRMENEWPLARTEWTKWYLDGDALSLETTAAAADASTPYEALGDGLNFTTPPFETETEFTGPLMARLYVSSSTTDLDLFATLRLLDPTGDEVVFVGAHEQTPVTRGWLRASHRKTDPKRSLPYRPYHSHDEIQKIEPDEIVALHVEIWPTSIVCPPGYRLVLTLQGRDFEYDVPGRMLHNDPLDRPKAEFGGINTIHTGGDHPSYLLMPLIPR
ncbi:MAG: CocE/NonD family hydrolase [Rhodospirillaceae bacterium]|jgi:uncharacterized protein|nr:CocE/NonD family hydrolase [Rhodospirillaceae bacterium]MBT5455175.1 CocE/NonD family hydrolase [Rhodospirillaceae bacterium]